MKARWFGANLEIHGLKQIVSLRFRRHQLGQVCYRRQPGKYVLNLKFTAFDPKPSSLHLRNCLIGARLDALSLHHEAKRTKVHVER
jgi:hypothetical protein